MNTPAYKPLLLASLLLVGVSCGSSHSESVSTGPFQPPPPSVFPEVEVNDFAWAPNTVGWVSGGDVVVIEGSITDAGWDPRDGFQFFATEPLVVSVSLNGHVPGSDLDWCVWDPVLGAYTVCAETAFNPEVGSFIVVPPGNEFHIVVSSYFGTTTYSMTVSFSTYFGAEAGGTGLEPLALTPRADPAADYGKDDRDATLAPDSEFAKGLAQIVAVTSASLQDSTGPTAKTLEPIFSGPLFELDK